MTYLYKLIPPRPTFPDRITPVEAEAMKQHVDYWMGMMAKGQAVVFGPVADPNGSFGIAVVQLEEGSDPAHLGVNDPAIRANVGFQFAVYPMPRAVVASPAPR